MASLIQTTSKQLINTVIVTSRHRVPIRVHVAAIETVRLRYHRRATEHLLVLSPSSVAVVQALAVRSTLRSTHKLSIHQCIASAHSLRWPPQFMNIHHRGQSPQLMNIHQAGSSSLWRLSIMPVAVVTGCQTTRLGTATLPVMSQPMTIDRWLNTIWDQSLISSSTSSLAMASDQRPPACSMASRWRR